MGFPWVLQVLSTRDSHGMWLLAVTPTVRVTVKVDVIVDHQSCKVFLVYEMNVCSMSSDDFYPLRVVESGIRKVGCAFLLVLDVVFEVDDFQAKESYKRPLR